MTFIRGSQGLLITVVTILVASSAYAASPGRKMVPVPSPALVPPRALQPSKHFRRGIEPSASIHAHSFIPTPIPPLNAFTPARGHRLTQPKKPVYHYTPIKPFSIEDLGNTYRGRGKAALAKNFESSRQSFGVGRDFLFSRTAGEFQRGISYGPQVYEATTDDLPPPRPILPPTPIRPEPVQASGTAELQVTLPVQSDYTGVFIPETELVDVKSIRLGEAVGSEGLGSRVVQRQNPAFSRYHFEYKVRDHDGEFGHAEARDGPLTTGGYDVNLRKMHMQSVRYFVDSKEVPRYEMRRYGSAFF